MVAHLLPPPKAVLRGRKNSLNDQIPASLIPNDLGMIRGRGFLIVLQIEACCLQ